MGCFNFGKKKVSKHQPLVGSYTRNSSITDPLQSPTCKDSPNGPSTPGGHFLLVPEGPPTPPGVKPPGAAARVGSEELSSSKMRQGWAPNGTPPTRPGGNRMSVTGPLVGTVRLGGTDDLLNGRDDVRWAAAEGSTRTPPPRPPVRGSEADWATPSPQQVTPQSVLDKPRADPPANWQKAPQAGGQRTSPRGEVDQWQELERWAATQPQAASAKSEMSTPNKEQEWKPREKSAGGQNRGYPGGRGQGQPGAGGAGMTSASPPASPRAHQVRTFTYAELRLACRNFRADCLLGEGGFGRVYKGKLEITGQVVAVKQLDREGLQGHREFLTEVNMLKQLYHPNLVPLLGYCSEGDQRLLVYEFMPRGSVEVQLLERPPSHPPLPWNIRLKIALDAARGLDYLHTPMMDPVTGAQRAPVIFRDFKVSNILLDRGWNARLSDFGLARDGPENGKTHVSTRVVGTMGYCAPEYLMTGHLTASSDVWAFGVVLLELLTGRPALSTKEQRQQTRVQWGLEEDEDEDEEEWLVNWVLPQLRNRGWVHKVVDPRLRGSFNPRTAQKVAVLATQCLRESPRERPSMSEVVAALMPLQEELGKVYDTSNLSSTRKDG